MGVSPFIYLLTCFATIGGMLFGYDTGIVSGSMILIRKKYNLSTIWQEAIVSGTIGTAAISSLLAGGINDKIGRKKTILMASVIFTVGAIVMAVADGKEVLLVGRLIVGVAIGFASMTVPMYVAEAAPSDIRGRLVTINQLFITIGIVVSSIIAGIFSSNKENGWRYMLGLGAVPSLIQIVGFAFFLPESPRWLVQHNRSQDAEVILMKIRGTSDVKSELQEIEKAVEDDRQTAEKGFALSTVLRTPHIRKALFVGCGLQFFQQLCGINTVIYYSASILQMAGFDDELSIWLAVVPNSVNFLCTFIGVFLVERVGRRLLIILSMIGVMFSCVILACGFQLQHQQTPPINSTALQAIYPKTDIFNNPKYLKCLEFNECDACIDEKCGFCFVEDQERTTGQCLSFDPDRDVHGSDFGPCYDSATQSKLGFKWAPNYCPTSVAWITILGLVAYVMSFAPGLGPMPWTINSEIYPTWARSTCNALSTGTNWTLNLVVSFTFLSLLEAITRFGTFYLFAGVCFVGVIFFYVFVPETKNKSLEEVEMLFMSPEERYKRKKELEGHDNYVPSDTKM